MKPMHLSPVIILFSVLSASADFTAELVGKGFTFKIVKPETVGTSYADEMVSACQQHGMRPVCNEASCCDSRGLNIGNLGALSNSDDRNHAIIFGNSTQWEAIKTHWVGKCNYCVGVDVARVNKVPCDWKKTWQLQSEFNPGFVCAKNGGGKASTSVGTTAPGTNTPGTNTPGTNTAGSNNAGANNSERDNDDAGADGQEMPTHMIALIAVAVTIPALVVVGFSVYRKSLQKPPRKPSIVVHPSDKPRRGSARHSLPPASRPPRQSSSTPMGSSPPDSQRNTVVSPPTQPPLPSHGGRIKSKRDLGRKGLTMKYIPRSSYFDALADANGIAYTRRG